MSTDRLIEQRDAMMRAILSMRSAMAEAEKALAMVAQDVDVASGDEQGKAEVMTDDVDTWATHAMSVRHDHEDQFVVAKSEINQVVAMLRGLQRRLLASESTRRELESAIRWALGDGGSDFSIVARMSAVGPYWWRPELRKRAGLEDTP